MPFSLKYDAFPCCFKMLISGYVSLNKGAGTIAVSNLCDDWGSSDWTNQRLIQFIDAELIHCRLVNFILYVIVNIMGFFDTEITRTQ